eukprot:scaffold131287_cov42-Phaeocystis_antarctica.AAC.1
MTSGWCDEPTFRPETGRSSDRSKGLSLELAAPPPRESALRCIGRLRWREGGRGSPSRHGGTSPSCHGCSPPPPSLSEVPPLPWRSRSSRESGPRLVPADPGRRAPEPGRRAVLRALPADQPCRGESRCPIPPSSWRRPFWVELVSRGVAQKSRTLTPTGAASPPSVGEIRASGPCALRPESGREPCRSRSSASALRSRFGPPLFTRRSCRVCPGAVPHSRRIESKLGMLPAAISWDAASGRVSDRHEELLPPVVAMQPPPAKRRYGSW